MRPGLFRGCVYSAPLALILWALIIAASNAIWRAL